MYISSFLSTFFVPFPRTIPLYPRIVFLSLLLFAGRFPRLTSPRLRPLNHALSRDSGRPSLPILFYVFPFEASSALSLFTPSLSIASRRSLSVSLSRSAIFFSEKKFVPFSCFSTSLLLPLSLRSFASFSLFLPTVISLSSPLSANHPLVPFSFLIDVAGNL